MNANSITIFAFFISNLANLCYNIPKKEKERGDVFMNLYGFSEALQRAYAGNDLEQAARLLVKESKELRADIGSLYQDLEMSYNYVQTHPDVSVKGQVIPSHSHTFAELLLCRNTCGVEYLLGTERFQLQRGDILVIPIGVSHSPLMGGLTEPYRRDVLWISAAFLETVAKMCPQLQNVRPYLLHTEGTRWEYLCDMFHGGVVESAKRETGWEAAVIGNTLQLLILLLRASQDRSAVAPPREKTELLDRAVVYIKENLADRITLADTARRFYVSESTISHIFQEKLGVSFYRFVTQHRLIAAKELILRGVPPGVRHQPQAVWKAPAGPGRTAARRRAVRAKKMRP